MGQSHTTESASESEYETPRPRGAATFFGLFGGKKDDYIDSTDSDITLEEHRRDRKKTRKQAPKKTLNIPPPERGNNHCKHKRISCATNQKTKTCYQPPKSQPLISELNKCISNRRNNCPKTSRVIGCRERSCVSTLFERQAGEEDKRTHQYICAESVKENKVDLIPTKEVESRNKYTSIGSSSIEKKPVFGTKENQRVEDHNPRSDSTACINKSSHSRFSHKYSQNTNGQSTPNEQACSRCGLSIKSSQSDDKTTCKCCCNAPETTGHIKIKNCENRSDKPVRSANETRDVSATTVESDVMNDYPRYSREPPEREQNVCGFAQHNIRSCCRSCCAQKKLDVPVCNSKPSHPSKYQKFCNNRPISDSYVVRNPNLEKVDPSLSRSAPNNTQKGTVSRVPSDQRAKIPLPPPPPSKDCQNRRSRQFDRQQSPVRVTSSDNTKPMYNPHNYNYNKQHYKNSYPYEEPPDNFSYTRETCCTHNCGGYERCSQHRRCKCQCMCEPTNYYPRRNVSDDQLSGCSESTKTDFMNLAYQRTGDYPELVDELENTLSQRNRMRVQKTMEQFEILSRQNKNLDRPIFDDEESCRHHRNSHCCNDCKCSYCKDSDSKGNSKSDNETCKSRSASLTKRSSFQANSLPRKPGYVEKVARCMDPNLNRKGGKYMSPPIFNNPNKNPNQRGNGTWQMDSRKGEWVKVGDGSYDFESSYPPLPPRPRSGHAFEDRANHREYSNRNSDMDRPCSCSKCIRHNR